VRYTPWDNPRREVYTLGITLGERYTHGGIPREEVYPWWDT